MKIKLDASLAVNILPYVWTGLIWSWVMMVKVAQLSSSPLLGYFLALVVIAVNVAIGGSIFRYAISRLRRAYESKKSLSAWFLLKIFLVWVLAEFVVALLTGLVWYGRQGSLDTILPFGSFTPLLMYTPLGYATRILGFYGLSAVFVTTMSTLLFSKLRRYAAAMVLLLISISTVGWLLYTQANGRTISVITVAETLSEKLPALPADADVVVFPEYGLDDVDSSSISKRLTKIDGGPSAYFVGSKQYLTTNGIQNVLLMGDTNGIIREQPKPRLAPGGEYLPYIVDIPLKLTGQKKIIEAFDFERAVTKGDKQIEVLPLMSDVVLGSEVCASIVSPDDYRHLVRNGATLLTNSASLEVFNSSPIFRVQHEGLARFMAVANARPFVQSAQAGDAYVLDHNGKELGRISPNNSLRVDLQTNDKTTLYSYTGEYTVAAAMMWMTWLSFRKGRAKFLARKQIS